MELRLGDILQDGPLVAHQLNIGSLAQVLHCLSKHRVVHQFKEIFVETVGGLFPLLGVESNVRGQPGGLSEGEDAVDG